MPDKTTAPACATQETTMELGRAAIALASVENAMTSIEVALDTLRRGDIGRLESAPERLTVASRLLGLAKSDIAREVDRLAEESP